MSGKRINASFPKTMKGIKPQTRKAQGLPSSINKAKKNISWCMISKLLKKKDKRDNAEGSQRKQHVTEKKVKRRISKHFLSEAILVRKTVKLHL